MMRLPLFHYRSPQTLGEASRILDGEGPKAMILAGGTDLLPNMKRRQQVPSVLIGLLRVDELRKVSLHGDNGLSLGACLTISEIVGNEQVRERFKALWQAASLIATPLIRNMGTLGGNLCLDTRCNYYNQAYEWRKAINFCLKKDGNMCWVATGSSHCLAVSSTDTAPALIALGARVRLVSLSGEREVPLSAFYRNDGITHLTRRHNEILAEVLLGSQQGWKSTYWKLRRRGSFDFPVLSVAAAAKISGGAVEEVRLVLGSVSSRPLIASEAETFLLGRPLDDAVIQEAATLASRIAKPLDNTDFNMTWRKKVSREFVINALRELRGDDMRDLRVH
jgi:4-hydroxybenzoyl-CoA reductase subunit beta